MQLKSIHDFARAANEEFRIDLGESSVSLTLIETRKLPAQPFPGMMREPFSLLFKSQSQLILPQRIYHLDNPTIGSAELFLVPVARDAQGIVYQAVFN